jgi:hypothetical protein
MIVERKQRRRQKGQERPEEALRTAVLAYLSEALPPTAFFCVFPMKAGGLFHGLKMREPGVRAGFPNLLVLHSGRAFCIELKTDAHLLEPSQRDCYAALQDARIPIVVARSLGDVQHFLCVDCALPMRSWRSAA